MGKSIPLSEIAEIIRGVSFGGADAVSSERPNYVAILRAGNIAEELQVHNDLIWVPSTKVKPVQYLRRGDIVICTSSGSSQIVGKTAILGSEWKGSVGAFCAIIRPKPQVRANFLAHFLRTPAFRKWTSNSSGANIKNIRVSELAEFQVPLPPLPEQKRIAAVLDKADAIRRKREKAIELTDSFLRSVFLEMFGEPIFNTKGWNKAPLETLCIKVVDCPHSTPQWQPAGKVCIRTSNLTKGGWDWSDTRYVSEQDFESRSRRAEVEAGDIILSREGTVGIAAIVEEGMSICMGQRLVQLRVNPKFLTSPYLLHLLLYELAPYRIERLMAGSTSKHLNVRDLRNLLVPTPPLHLQEKFAKVCKTTSRLFRKANQSLTLSNQLVASLSTNVLSSRVQQSEPDLLREEAYAL